MKKGLLTFPKHCPNAPDFSYRVSNYEKKYFIKLYDQRNLEIICVGSQYIFVEIFNFIFETFNCAFWKPCSLVHSQTADNGRLLGIDVPNISGPF